MLITAQGQDIFSIFLSMKVRCLFSLESPYRGDSNEYKQYTICNIEKKITLNYSKSAAAGFFPGDSGTSSKQPWKTSHLCSSHIVFGCWGWPGDHLHGKLLFTWLTLIASLVVTNFVLSFPTR